MGFNLPANATENLIGSIRELARRVRRWRDGKTIVHWTAAALIQASKQFRRLRGAGVSKLVAALRAHDAAFEGAVDRNDKAA